MAQHEASQIPMTRAWITPSTLALSHDCCRTVLFEGFRSSCVAWMSLHDRIHCLFELVSSNAKRAAIGAENGRFPTVMRRFRDGLEPGGAIPRS
jgi:hypothetical protein